MITWFWGAISAIGAGIGLFAGEREKKAKIRAQREAEVRQVEAERKGLEAQERGAERMTEEYRKGMESAIATQKEYGEKAISELQKMYQDIFQLDRIYWKEFRKDLNP